MELKKADVDLTFIKTGVTSRIEVATKLAHIDCGAPNEFFWGRWADSSWGVVAGAVTDTSRDKVEHGTGRHWQHHNVLVTFDSAGVADTVRKIDSDEVLWHELLLQLRRLPSSGSKKVLHVASSEKRYRYMILSPDSLQFEAAKLNDSVTVQLSRPMTIDLHPQFRSEMLQSPQLVCYRLEMTGARVSAKQHAFGFCTAGTELLQILSYLGQVIP